MSDLDHPHARSRLDETTAVSAGPDVTLDWVSSDPASPAREHAPRPLPRPPQHAGRYQLLDEIARGGMGVIYRATDTALGREVAVKVLQDRFPVDSGTARRFADEARITAGLQHPGVPPVHDLGVLPDGRPFLAMKLIRGHTLDHLLKHCPDPAADRGRFVAIFEHVCQAVAYAHAHRVVHRDLKPANIMVGSFGDVQVMDWGLAKVLSATPAPAPAARDPEETVTRAVLPAADLAGDSDASFTQAGSMLGTLCYMPPEQAAGEVARIGPPSDVFGLGAILAVILTGQPPYDGADTETIRVMALRGDLAACRARLDACAAEPELVALCKRCLAFDPADRPPQAGAVADEVAALRAASEERARAAEKERAAAEARAAEQRLRRRWQAALAAAVVLIVALLAGGAWWADRQAADRDKEHAVAAERDRQEAAVALEHAEQALSACNLPAVDHALALAEQRLAAPRPSALDARLATAKRDRDLLLGLRDIEDLDWLPGSINALKSSEMAKRYESVFARYGLDVARSDPAAADSAAAADSVRSSRVSASLLTGLGEWFCADPRAPHLDQLLDHIDASPDRTALRSAIRAGDQEKVRALARALDGASAPPWFAASVGNLPGIPPADGVRLMAAAWRTHPDDYMLALRTGRRTWDTGRPADVLAWAKVAVALRPGSRFAHNLLSNAWRALRNYDEAEASARRVIALSRDRPNFAGGQISLGNVLLDKGDLDAAEASYHAALAINPNSPGVLYNLGLLHSKRGDLDAAEEWYRKAVAADPSRPAYRQSLDGVLRKTSRPGQTAPGLSDPANAPSPPHP